MTYISKITTKSYDLAIAEGTASGYSHINKFGRNTDIDTTQEDVWTGGGTYTYSTTADITHVVSSSASDTFEVEVQGLDTNWEQVTQTKTLTGTTGVALDTPLIRVFRMKNNSGTIAVGTIQVGVGAVTSAFTAGNLRGNIVIGFGQTLMAQYTIPLAKTGILTGWWADINKTNTTGALDVNLWARSDGGVWRIQSTVGLQALGTSHFQHFYKPYAVYSAKTDLKVTGIGSTNNFDVSAGFDLILKDD